MCGRTTGSRRAGEWHKVILERLDQADIILLLLSQDFLMSEYITDVELKTALDRYMAGKSRVIPIFARNCELRRYPGITALQGLPKNMAFFHGADEEDKLLTSIQQEIDTIAGELSLNRKLASSVDDADEKGKMAREIIQLRENRKIFLCLSVSDEGKKRRRELMYHVEGKVRHEKWPFEVVPGINSQQDPNDPDVQTQMKDSVYSIHIVSHPNELVEGPGRLQYDLACQRAKQQSFYRIIIWYPDASIRTSMEPSFVGELATHPNFMGYDYEDLFALLDSLEEERQRSADGGDQQIFRHPESDHAV
ncbi:hypothetical protein ACQ86N_01200 [Puia sp. P3]|uniref:hypothetical protein n=1 Tax=Puia sp. P3 TaxID=3423952 RepID=UPI003D66FD15